MFSKKRLKVEVQMLEGEFSPNVSKLTFENLPIEVSINVVDMKSGGSAKIRIYGASKSHMAWMETIKWKVVPSTPKKAVRVFADDGDGYKLIFEGNITDALPRYENAPDVYIDINAHKGAYQNVREVPPFSRKGEVPTYQVFRDIAAQYEVGFVNHGVETSCKNPYFDEHGLCNRLTAAAKAYDVYVIQEDYVVHIYPQKTGVAKKWEFTKNSYIGYPTITDTGIKINFDTVYAIGLRDYFTISDSEVSAANENWKIIKYNYNLSTKIDGKWFMTIEGQKVAL